MAEWTSVDERLPEKDGSFIVYGYENRYGFRRIDICCLYYEKWCVIGDFVVTHWMPLPKPPTHEKRKDKIT